MKLECRSKDLLCHCEIFANLWIAFVSFQALIIKPVLLNHYPVFQLYNLTLNGFLGATYCLSAAFAGVNLLGMCVIYYFIWKNENKYGPLGTRDEKLL